MPEVDRYKPTRTGPGTIRDPLEVADPPDDVSDESWCEHDHDDGEQASPSTEASSASAAHASADIEDVEQLNYFETPIGINPTAVPTYVQQVGGLAQNSEHVRDSRKARRTLQQEGTT